MSDTGISEQIATLREQIAAVEAEIQNHQSRLKAQPGGQAAAAEAELTEFTKSREFMLYRLSRLESCQHGFDR
jgi:uncharacterized protein involved in exopolysaccharide biosynthesis